MDKDDFECVIIFASSFEITPKKIWGLGDLHHPVISNH